MERSAKVFFVDAHHGGDLLVFGSQCSAGFRLAMSAKAAGIDRRQESDLLLDLCRVLHVAGDHVILQRRHDLAGLDGLLDHRDRLVAGMGRDSGGELALQRSDRRLQLGVFRLGSRDLAARLQRRDKRVAGRAGRQINGFNDLADQGGMCRAFLLGLMGGCDGRQNLASVAFRKAKRLRNCSSITASWLWLWSAVRVRFRLLVRRHAAAE
ncbi:hypothetical protein OU993_12280 [Rhizobium sp. SL86]|nr:hypothetical protein [Rhizobium sp. SL86]MCY1666251.1 hypothetical protein [Rhizobium sp. SL86]